jgi:hypothetical protein
VKGGKSEASRSWASTAARVIVTPRERLGMMAVAAHRDSSPQVSTMSRRINRLNSNLPHSVRSVGNLTVATAPLVPVGPQFESRGRHGPSLASATRKSLPVEVIEVWRS